MIYGIGIDLIEIERIKNLQNQTKFIERILTIEERDKLNQYTNEQRRLEFLAGRFTVKEAFSKYSFNKFCLILKIFNSFNFY